MIKDLHVLASYFGRLWIVARDGWTAWQPMLDVLVGLWEVHCINWGQEAHHDRIIWIRDGGYEDGDRYAVNE